MTIKEAYSNGYALGISGQPDKENCNWRIFETRETTDAWAKGKDDGLVARHKTEANEIAHSADSR